MAKITYILNDSAGPTIMQILIQHYTSIQYALTNLFQKFEALQAHQSYAVCSNPVRMPE